MSYFKFQFFKQMAIGNPWLRFLYMAYIYTAHAFHYSLFRFENLHKLNSGLSERKMSTTTYTAILLSANSACQEGSPNLPRQIVNPGFAWLGLERCHLPVSPLGESHHELFGSLITKKRENNFIKDNIDIKKTWTQQIIYRFRQNMFDKHIF
jgi:hypothetical protein